MDRVSLGAVMLIAMLVIGCDLPKPTPPVYSVEHFEFIPGNNVGDLNSWRQEHFDKHIVSFNHTGDGFILYWNKNPGNSRQTFVTVVRDKEYPNIVEQLAVVEKKFTHKRIVDMEWYKRTCIILLQDTLEPYEPSQD